MKYLLKALVVLLFTVYVVVTPFWRILRSSLEDTPYLKMLSLDYIDLYNLFFVESMVEIDLKYKDKV